jgi:chitin disaccharide deacetylase
VVDHDFLGSFSLDLDTKASRYLQLLHELPAGLSEWAVHPGRSDPASRKIDNGWRVRHTDLEFLISAEARERPYVGRASSSSTMARSRTPGRTGREGS